MKKNGSLLWVDDVLIITTKTDELQQALDITDETSGTYHIEYGQSKSNTQIIGRRRKAEEQITFNLGDIPLEMTDKYKYLGLIQNSKNNHEDHITQCKEKPRLHIKK